MAERRIARRLGDRDPEATSLILAEYGRSLRGYLGQILGADRELVDDVMQQLLLEAWQRGPSYDSSRGSVLTWLMTIGRSRAIDLLRRRVPEPRDPDQSALLAVPAGDESDPAERLAARWQLAHLLSTLPPEQARLLQMRFQFGMSQSEIAAQTGIPLGTVKTRMISALSRLRDRVDEQT